MTQPAIERLLSIMRTLRDPQRGCPWDCEQTFDTIARYTLEEAYEVLDAIQRHDYSDLREELGDLLFQVVFYAQMSKEQELFDFDDICHAVSEKLVRRHPHVFDQSGAIDSVKSLVGWEQHKASERAAKAQHSVLDNIPTVLPALMRAHKLQQRCAAVGFDWNSQEPVLEKVYEEIDEVMYEAGQTEIDKDKLGEELGDLLFAVVNLTRHMGYQAEMILQAANRKFERRFRQVEEQLSAGGKTLDSASLEEMDAVWQQVKQQEKSLV